MSKSLVVYPSSESIETKIFFIRGKKVMLDRHLADLYKVSTKVLNQAVKRNLKRFPEDFMFQLSKEETENWRSRFVTSNSKANMSLRYSPYAFTENGISMVRRGADQTNSRDDPAGVQGNVLQGDPTYRMPKGSWDKSLLGK